MTNCDTCKHNPPSKKFPCIDCDMRNPADRWESQEVKNSTESSLTQKALDTVSRQAAKKAYCKSFCYPGVFCPDGLCKEVNEAFDAVPSAQPEPLTDKEQRIFLAAMGREEKVCEEVDRNYVREPYEDSLVRVCKEIRRKVKGALWI